MRADLRAGKEQTARNRLVFEDVRRRPARKAASPRRGAVKRSPDRPPGGVKALDHSPAMLCKLFLAKGPFSWRQNALPVEYGP